MKVNGNDVLVRFGNYKLPLRKPKQGYGYMGVLLYDNSTGLIQCHVCGEFFKAIRQSHLLNHNTTINEYRKDYGILQSTALVSEETRSKCILAGQKGFDKLNILNHSIDGIEKAKQRAKELSVKNKGRKIAVEGRNKTGTCPDQLLDKIKLVAKKLGKAPSKKDFKNSEYGKHLGSIYYTFGSYVKAVELCDLKSQYSIVKEKYSNENLLWYLKNFYEKK